MAADPMATATRLTTVVFHEILLGMFLVPGEAGRGARIKHFQRNADGSLREAERAKSLKEGMQLIRVDDINIQHSDFIRVVDLVQKRGRPLKVVFSDPMKPEFRDSFDFLCSESQMQGELRYLQATKAQRAEVDRDWSDFLSGLARGTAYGAGWASASTAHDSGAGIGAVSAQDGVQWLSRDARGVIAFDGGVGGAEGAVGAAAQERSDFLMRTAESARGGDALRLLSLHSAGGGAAAAGAGLGRFSGGPFSRTPLPTAMSAADAAADAAESTVRAMRVFKRCWRPGSIGVPASTGRSTPEAARAAAVRGRAALLAEPAGAGPDGRAVSLERRAALSARLAELVSRGVPAAYRGSVWFALSGAAAKRALHPPGYYDTLSHCRADAVAARIVRKDVPRTFPGHPFFETDRAQEALARLLLALAAHSPDTGYCQSLNFVAALLLWVMPEEDAFWTLDVLLTEVLPPQFWSPDMTGCRADQTVLEALCRKLLPRLHGALEGSGLPLSMVTTEWAVALFSTVLPVHTVLRVWDCVFLHGSEALFRVAVALLARGDAKLVELGLDSPRSPGGADPSSLAGMGGVFQLVKTLPYDVHDEDALIAAAFPLLQHRAAQAGPRAALARFLGRGRATNTGGAAHMRVIAGGSDGEAAVSVSTIESQPAVRWGSFGVEALAQYREAAWHALRQSGVLEAGKGAPGKGKRRAVGASGKPAVAAEGTAGAANTAATASKLTPPTEDMAEQAPKAAGRAIATDTETAQLVGAKDAGLEADDGAGDAGLEADDGAEDAGLEAGDGTGDAGLEADDGAEDAGLEADVGAEDAGLEADVGAEDAGLEADDGAGDAGLEADDGAEDAGLEADDGTEDAGLEADDGAEDAGLEGDDGAEDAGLEADDGAEDAGLEAGDGTGDAGLEADDGAEDAGLEADDGAEDARAIPDDGAEGAEAEGDDSLL